MKATILLMTFSILLGGLAYYVYYPFPEDAKQPWRQMALSVVIRTVTHMCDFGEAIGYSSEIQCKRRFAEVFLQSYPEELSDADLVVTEPLFSGVKVRLFIPRDPHPTGYVYMHGGGWMFGNVNLYDRKTRIIAKSLKAVVVSVELAPEHPFPVPLQDCIDVVKYFIENADKYGVDPNRIGIGGDSAGGNLAIAVALTLTRDGMRPPLRVLSLVYPALQMADFNLPSFRTYTNGPFLLKKRLMVSAWLNYAFGNEANIEEFLKNNHISPKSKLKLRKFMDLSLLQGQEVSNQYNNECNATLAKEVEDIVFNQFISPLLATDDDLRKLPKTYLLTCQYDPLRDEGIILAKRLKNLNMPVYHTHWTGVEHGFFSTRVNLDKTKLAIENFLSYLKDNL